MQREDAINALIDLGMTTGEAKTYVALVINGPSEATPLASLANVHQPKIYEYLKALISKNYVKEIQTGERARIFEAIAHETVLKDLDKKLQEKKELSSVFLGTNKFEGERDDPEGVHVDIGERAVLISLQDIFEKAELNIVMILNKNYKNVINDLITVHQDRINITIVNFYNSPGLLSTLNLELIKKLKKEVMDELGDMQPMYIMVDTDPITQTAKSSSIVTPGLNDNEPFIVTFTQRILVDYQTKFVHKIIELMEKEKLNKESS